MLQIVGPAIGCSLVAASIGIMVYTIRDIGRSIGWDQPRAYSWLAAVIVGLLFGVILYWFFRGWTESLFRR